MFKRMKEYREYRNNMRVAKREFAKLASTSLPLISLTSANALKFVQFVTKVMNECNDFADEELLDRLETITHDTVSVFADKFEVDEPRLFEILQYISTLSTEDLRKIVVDATVETLHTGDNND